MAEALRERWDDITIVQSDLGAKANPLCTTGPPGPRLFSIKEEDEGWSSMGDQSTEDDYTWDQSDWSSDANNSWEEHHTTTADVASGPGSEWWSSNEWENGSPHSNTAWILSRCSQ